MFGQSNNCLRFQGLRTTSLYFPPSNVPCAGMQVAVDVPLMSAGLDSLSSVELRNALQARFGLDMPVTVMFDHPTVQALAGFITGQLLEKEPIGQKLQVVRSSPVAALQDLVGQLQGIVSGVLGNSVPADQPLMAAGLDSLGKLA